MKNEKDVVLKYENRLLKNEKSWRRARIGSIFLFLIFLMAILAIYRDDLMSADERRKALTAIAIWCLFWLMIIDWLTLRIRHIDSINLYRKKQETSKD